MKSRSKPVATTLVLAALLALSAPGCGRQSGLFFALHPNQRPTVDLTAAPVGTADTAWYAYEIQWSGHDADGRVVRYEYAIDPPAAPAADTAWIATTRNGERFHFRATEAYWHPVHGWRANGYHTFAIRAVDDAGAYSAVVSRAFYAYTIAPTVTIIRPVPSKLVSRVLPPGGLVAWTGRDDDGVRSKTPVKYKYRVFRPDDPEFDFQMAQSYPDSLRAFYAARGFAGWDSVGGDTTEVRLRGLEPNRPHLFAVIAIDEAGAYSPDFSLESNLLKFTPGDPGTLGPVFTLWNGHFFYLFASGGIFTDPRYWVSLEVPAGHALTVNWLATPRPGANLAWCRWRLDGDITDETPRTDEDTDWYRWSRRDSSLRSCTVGPFPGGETHFLYLEAADDDGMRSLAVLAFSTIALGGERELLVVDDTRLQPDQFLAGSPVPRAYGNSLWPAAAELDTFLFARGGFPWRGPHGVTGAMPSSPPGVFAGYPYDTLGTRQGFTIPSAGVPLSLLGRYRHVVWLTDVTGAITTYGPDSPVDPISTLRWMSAAGRSSTLAAYVYSGGRVWLAGGTAGTCTLLPFNATGSRNNDALYGPGHAVFSYSSGELAPNRLMWDAAHWRSEFVASRANTAPRRSAAAVGGWSHPGWKYAGTISAPDYSRLPAQLRRRALALGDSLPPTRATNPASFYSTAINPAVEYLTLDNVILEDMDPDPAVTDTRAALDTLYELQGGNLATVFTGRRPVTMTYYHGVETPPFVFSGFDLWTWSRQDVAGLVDFVLQDIWGMSRTTSRPAAHRPSPGGSGARPHDRPTTRPPARLPGAR